MLNFKTFQSAKCVLAGIELMHMIRKGQFMMQGCSEMSFADQFYALVQDKSVQFEEPGFALTRNTFVSRQRDRTAGTACSIPDTEIRILTSAM